ncbi:DUF1294 domain-containing protein [uncultured Sulfitobacter sp.]|uniref:DUF1294 domain-containing protein n=1 Tax=uncultured Sulfitobacter sp. TaxID=191468 RepID=UPI00345B361A
MLLALLILAYFAAVNVVAYRAFARDKQFAIDRQQRTPEARLLFWAALGGWCGAKYAQQKLRHKSYKQPFGRHLNEIGMIQGMVLGLFALTFGVMMLFPAVDSPSTPSSKTASGASETRPDPAPPSISLRPPVGRPAGL